MNFEKPKLKKHTPEDEDDFEYTGWLKKMREKIPRPELVALGLYLSSLAGTAQASEAQNKDPDTLVQDIQESLAEADEYVEETVDEVPIPDDAYFRFEKEDTATGKAEFNWWALIAPLQVELGREMKEETTIEIEIPYRFSRMFDEAQAMNPEDRAKAMEYIEQEMQRELAASIKFLDFSDNSREVYEHHHGESKESPLDESTSPKIDYIRIMGSASPEAGIAGSESVLPGNVEQENVSLAETRAGDMEPVVKEALERLGIDASEVIAGVSGEELQFTDDELEQLHVFAEQHDMGGTTHAEQIFELIRAYNDGALDEQTSTALDEIVGAKRMVTVEVGFEAGQQERWVVPVPLTLLMLASFPYLFRRKGESRGGNEPTDYDAGDAGLDRLIFSDKTIPPDKKESVGQQEFATRYKDALTSIVPPERKIMERELFINEFTRYFDDPQTKARGLDYAGIIHTIAKALDKADQNENEVNEEGVKREVAQELLHQWQKHDRIMRPRSQSPEYVVKYDQDPKKIAWAAVGAEQLLQAGEILLAHKVEPKKDDPDIAFDWEAFKRELDRHAREFEQ